MRVDRQVMLEGIKKGPSLKDPVEGPSPSNHVRFLLSSKVIAALGSRWVSWLTHLMKAGLQLRDSAGLPFQVTGFPLMVIASGR